MLAFLGGACTVLDRVEDVLSDPDIADPSDRLEAIAALVKAITDEVVVESAPFDRGVKH